MPGVMRDNRFTQISAEPLLAALEHLQASGSLLSLVPDRAKRLGLTRAMSKQGLIQWDGALHKYALTSLGQRCLTERQGAAHVAGNTALNG
jgi:hypothetical protein